MLFWIFVIIAIISVGVIVLSRRESAAEKNMRALKQSTKALITAIVTLIVKVQQSVLSSTISCKLQEQQWRHMKKSTIFAIEK